MENAQKLREKRAEKIEALRLIDAGAEGEKRSLTADEKSNWDKLDAEIRELVSDIERAEKREQLARESIVAGGGVNHSSDKEKRDISQFSVLKALRSLIDNKPLEGLEAEMHQEAVNEARAIGQSINGVGIPSFILQEKRDNSITMPTQPEDGSAIVQKTVYGSMADMLRDALVTRRLGATYLNDLVGNISFTRMTQLPEATWKPEVGALDKSNIKFASDDLSPKRIGTYTIQSLQFLRQTAASVEQKIRREIIDSISRGVDKAAIVGTGANNQPLGLLNNPSVTTLPIDTNGGALTRADLVAAETLLASRNLNGDSYAWLLNALSRGLLKNTLLDAGSGRFLMENNNSLMEYPVVMSNLVPGNLTKGSGTNLSAAIFGDWSELYIGQWGGIDLTVDPYTLAVEGQIRIIAQGFFNILAHRPEAFVAFKDINTTIS